MSDERRPRQLQPKLACPLCGCGFSTVIARNLAQPTDQEYRRQRKCQSCGAEFETQEIVGHVVKTAISRDTNHAA